MSVEVFRASLREFTSEARRLVDAMEAARERRAVFIARMTSLLTALEGDDCAAVLEAVERSEWGSQQGDARESEHRSLDHVNGVSSRNP